MNQKFSTKNIENDEFNMNSKESEYSNLVDKLKSIKEIIALLEKKYLDKF